MKPFLTILPVLLIFFSCGEKPDPITIMEDPLFGIEAKLDGEDLTLQAGVDGYFMQTSFEQDEYGVYTLIGALQPKNCTDCRESLRILIRDVQVREMGAPVDISQALKAGNYAFLRSEAKLLGYRTRFTALPQQQTGLTYQWDLGDGTLRRNRAFNHIYPTLSPTNYQVKLEITAPDGCFSELTQDITIPKPSCYPAFHVNSVPGSRAIDFEAIPNGTAPFTYLWDFGDNQRATIASPNHEYANRGAYKACLTVQDGNACQATHCRNVTAGEVNGCAVNFSYETEPIIDFDSLALSKVILEWTDENGELFTTKLEDQPLSSFFMIESHQAFDPNEAGQKTEQLKFHLKCDLFDSTRSTTLSLEVLSGDIAVAYP